MSLVLLGLSWYQAHTVRTPSSGGSYNEGVVGQLYSANPLLARTAADWDVIHLTNRGLLRYAPDGQLTPDLASDWQLNNQQTEYTVQLKPNLRWSDGKTLTADDVVFTFQSILDQNLQSPLRDNFKGLTITKKDTLTVTFALPSPFVAFPHALTLALLPAHVWQTIPTNQWVSSEFNFKPVGAGPFRVASISHDTNGDIKSVAFAPNQFFSSSPYIRSVTLRFYPDQPSAFEALRQGSIDGLGGFGTGIAQHLSSKKFTLYQLPLPEYTAIFYNQTTNQILKDKKIRQGLTYALNRTEIVSQALGNSARPAWGPFPFDEGHAYAGANPINFDPAQATHLFEQAGFSRPNPNSPYQKDGKILEIDLTTTNQDDLLTVAQVIKQEWERVGVSVNLTIIDANELWGNLIKTKNYQALLVTQTTGLDPDPYPFWHSSQITNGGLNLALFQNREADRLLVEARQTNDPKARWDRYHRFQDILNAEVPSSFLFSANYNYALDKDIQGVSDHVIADPANRFDTLNTWYRSTRHQWVQ